MAISVARYWPAFAAVLATGAIVGFGTTRLGSFAATRAYLRGDALLVEPTTIELGYL